MSYIALGAIGALVISACIPKEEIRGVIDECREVVDHAVSEAVNECGEVVDNAVIEAQDSVWRRCSEYYEDEVVPEIERRLQEALSEAIGDLEAWFEMQLDMAKDDTFNELGCTEDAGSPFGWDCSDSVICD